jgi:hypothetical protein
MAGAGCIESGLLKESVDAYGIMTYDGWRNMARAQDLAMIEALRGLD